MGLTPPLPVHTRGQEPLPLAPAGVLAHWPHAMDDLVVDAGAAEVLQKLSDDYASDEGAPVAESFAWFAWANLVTGMLALSILAWLFNGRRRRQRPKGRHQHRSSSSSGDGTPSRPESRDRTRGQNRARVDLARAV